MNRPYFRDAGRHALAGLLVGVLASGAALGQVPLRLTPSVALTAAKPKLAVLVVGLDQAAFAQTARLAYFAEQSIIRADRFEVVKLTEALDPENARARTSRFEEADATMKAGEKAYGDLDTLKALQHYEKAVKLYEQTDLTKNFQGLVQAWLMKSASMIANGENKAAEAELDRVIPLDPRATLSTDFFPPDAIAYAEKVKKSANANATNTLDVKTTPVNAQIYVDGRFQGIAPLKIAGLTPAEHYVTAVAPGFSLGQQRARSGAVEFELRKADGFPRYQAAADKVKLDAAGPQRDLAAQEFGRFLGVEQVLLAVLKKSTAGEKLEVTALRIEVKDGHNHSYKAGELTINDALPQSADTFFSALSQADDPRKGGPVTHFANGNGGGGRKTLGYALLGVGGALVAGGLFFGISASGQSSAFRDTHAQNSSAAASAASTGRTYALLADIFVLAGLGSAGAGGYFAFAGGKGAGKSDGDSVQPVLDKKREPPAKRDSKKSDDDLRDAENRKKADDAKKKAEAEALEAEQEQQRATAEAAEKRAAEDARRQAEEDARKKSGKKLSRKEQAEEDKRRREEEATRKAEDDLAKKKSEEEAAKKKADDAKKKAEEEAAAKAEEEKKKAAEKKKKSEEDDLRNY